MKNKTLLIILLLLLSPNFISAQNFKEERRIFLWDVTLSMWGYGEAPNIGEEVRENLIQAIGSISDERTEIVLIPFQDKVYDVWKANANTQGKKELLSLIKGIQSNKLDTTRTNICGAWEKATSLLTSDKRNYIFLLTDGNQNSKKNSKNCLYSNIQDWCELAKQNDGFAFYVMLTQKARNPRLETIINNCNRIETVTGTNVDVIEIRPQNTRLYINVPEEQYTLNLKFISNHMEALPTNFAVALHMEENPFFKIDDSESFSMDHGNLHFTLQPQMPLNQIRNKMAEEMTLPLHISIDGEKYPRVFATPSDFVIVLKNKKEKILKIQVVEK